MRISELLMPRAGASEAAAEGDPLVRAGYCLRLADGLYSLLPLGHRVLQRLAALVRRELVNVGAQELTLPLLQPRSLWERPLDASGTTRAAAFGSQLFAVSSSPAAPLVLSPTHEEVAAIVAAACLREPSDVPRTLFHIAPRFRDQQGSAALGLLRTREFVMADAYSFHADRADVLATYEAIKAALCRALDRAGLSALVVEADLGAIGGEASEELIVELPTGEPVALCCARCGYAASLDVARKAYSPAVESAPRALREVAVHDGSSDAQIAATLGMAPGDRLACSPFLAAGRVVLAALPCASALNVAKLHAALRRAGLDTSGFHPASLAELSALGATYDTISLAASSPDVLIVADDSVRGHPGFFLPARRAGHWLAGACTPRDFRVDLFADLTVIDETDPCPSCRAPLRIVRGIEVGHVFRLGTAYAAAFGATLGDAALPLHMGCYGLGLTRLIATLAEHHSDARGLVWPERVAPYHAIVLPGADDPDTRAAAMQLHTALHARGHDVLIDDRVIAAAQRVAFAEQLGIPLQLIVHALAPAAGLGTASVTVRERVTGREHRLPASELDALLAARAERSLC